MVLFVKIIGILMISVAIIMMISPASIRKFLNWAMEDGKVIYFGGVVRLVIGIFLLLAASQCKIPIVIVILGILTLATGISVFLIGLERCRKLLDYMLKRNDMALRFILLIPIVVAVLMLISA